MTFETIERLKDPRIEKRRGQYLTSYYSDHRQVRADLFTENGELKAYLRVVGVDDFLDTTDPWLEDLLQEAERRGYKDRFRWVYIDPRTMLR